MNLKAKVYVENQKKRVQEALNARLERLKEKGLKEDLIQKDATVRKLKAQVRKADHRLASIAAQEKLNQERVQAKLDKQAAEKAAKEAPQPEAEKGEPEKKEKKAKKEKREKQAKPEGKVEEKKEKKEKPEKPKKAPEKEEDQ
jgi:outer membrane biosynthesis protein TonB